MSRGSASAAKRSAEPPDLRYFRSCKLPAQRRQSLRICITFAEPGNEQKLMGKEGRGGYKPGFYEFWVEYPEISQETGFLKLRVRPIYFKI